MLGSYFQGSRKANDSSCSDDLYQGTTATGNNIYENKGKIYWIESKTETSYKKIINGNEVYNPTNHGM